MLRPALFFAAACMAALPLEAAKKHALTALEVYENVLRAQRGQAALSCEISREEPGQDGMQRVSGTLKTLAGGRARLEITVPSYQLMVSDGKSLYVELAEARQVMRYDAAQLRKSGNFFLDLGSSIRHYAKASLKRLIPVGEGFDEKKVSALELMPLKPEEAGFERMRVWVDRKRLAGAAGGAEERWSGDQGHL
jgi:outer membrane lipoprotein-sorting protein